MPFRKIAVHKKPEQVIQENANHVDEQNMPSEGNEPRHSLDEVVGGQSISTGRFNHAQEKVDPNVHFHWGYKTRSVKELITSSLPIKIAFSGLLVNIILNLIMFNDSVYFRSSLVLGGILGSLLILYLVRFINPNIFWTTSPLAVLGDRKNYLDYSISKIIEVWFSSFSEKVVRNPKVFVFLTFWGSLLTGILSFFWIEGLTAVFIPVMFIYVLAVIADKQVALDQHGLNTLIWMLSIMWTIYCVVMPFETQSLDFSILILLVLANDIKTTFKHLSITYPGDDETDSKNPKK